MRSNKSGGLTMTNTEIRDAIISMVKILDKGIMMEHNARTFYLNAATNVKQKQGKILLEWLADFESGHEARLQKKKKELLDHAVMQDYKLSELGEYAVSETGSAISLPNEPTETDILKVALENEKKAYMFFQKKISFANDPTIEAMFKEMAHEEQRHIEILDEQLKSLKSKQMWVDMQEFDEIMKSIERKRQNKG
jgi:rubrerythrin